MKHVVEILGFNLLLIFVSSVYSDGVMTFELPSEHQKNVKTGNICPNNRTKCTDSQTCCQTKHNSYHCCKYANAVCCPDKFHCCPNGTTCDRVHKRCTRHIETKDPQIQTTPEPMEMPVIDETDVKDITEQTCPNNRTKCQDSQTCCVTKHNSYHCCKFANAVCCPDKFHCCPQGSTCDTKLHKCVKCAKSNVEMTRLTPALNVEDIAKVHVLEQKIDEKDEVMCPNNKTKCKDTKTCCITKHNNYYCCPHKNAVCCSDKYQCCPQGTTCDLKNKKCLSASFTVESHKNEDIVPHDLLPAVMSAYDIISKWFKMEKRCSDQTYSCPGKKNCCVMDAGKFGCCKYNHGVCCPDLKTCCPHQTECDDKNNRCLATQLPLVQL